MTSPRTALALLFGLAAGACGAKPDASPPAKQRTPARESPPRASTATPPAAAVASGTSGNPKADSTGRGGTGRPPKPAPDSAILIQIATQPKLRTKADSISLVASIRAGLKNPGWPVKTPPAAAGSILPAKRIVAFYGNPLSKRMGILGEIPYDQMLAKLDTVVAEWRAADPTTPVLPALHLIVSVAQGAPGKDGMYRQRSDPDLIEKIYGLAQAQGRDHDPRHSGRQEHDRLGASECSCHFSQRPDVHLGIDPEFYMHYNREGRVPGTKIGTMDAKDVNYAIDQLAELVTKYHLPPKVLIVHRFTTNMLQHANQIKLDPRVQVVINMDGWGQPWLKFDTYAKCEVDEPVQFTGFKLFFHNDTKKGDPLLSPREVLALRPRPLYIQYQ